MPKKVLNAITNNTTVINALNFIFSLDINAVEST
jgi:hypothetical protein